MDEERGMMMDQAYEIVKKTWSDIGALKDDIERLLPEYDSSMKYPKKAGAYMYTSEFQLPPYLTFRFERILRDSKPGNIKEERVLAVVCIFYEGDDISRVNLKDQPELWAALLDIKNRKDKQGWIIPNKVFGLDKRKHFTNGELRIGGDVFEYDCCDANTKGEMEEWRGRVVGYPLVDITNKEVLQTKIMDKLFNVDEKNDA